MRRWNFVRTSKCVNLFSSIRQTRRRIRRRELYGVLPNISARRRPTHFGDPYADELAFADAGCGVVAERDTGKNFSFICPKASVAIPSGVHPPSLVRFMIGRGWL